jgi:uncharacterized Zn finger protein
MASAKSYPTLEERVQEVLESYEIKELPDGIFTMKAPSAQEAYTVDTKNNRCTCPAGQKGKPCKHMAAAKELLKQKEEKHEMEPREAMRILGWVVKQDPEKLLDLSSKQEAKVFKALATILLRCYEHVTKQELEKLLE